MEPVLKVRSLRKSFTTPQGPIEVLSGIDLDIEAGCSVSIRGESGSGKTTLLNIISSLEAADSGDILWEGVPLGSKSDNWVTRKRGSFIGFVFQSYYLIPELNTLENVLIAKRIVGRITKEDRAQASQLLKQVGLASREKSLVYQLSGGERQRVALVRALVNRPKLIVADEPTGNLDEHTAQEVMHLMLDLCAGQGASVLLVTHSPVFAKSTDREFFLHLGKLNPLS